MDAAERVDPPPGNTPNFGPNVYVFTPSMSTCTIQSDINAVYNTQQSNQFGTQRYELMFEPGTYNVSVPVGFYTEVVGLGQNPTQTVITGGGIYANAAWNDGNATENFWRGVENITIDPSSGSTEWAVSQADPMRRVQIDGNLVLDDDTTVNPANQWSSGGYISDSIVTGQVNSGTQQQFIMRNDQLGSWTGSNWNMVFVGEPASPPRASPARRTRRSTRPRPPTRSRTCTSTRPGTGTCSCPRTGRTRRASRGRTGTRRERRCRLAISTSRRRAARWRR